MISRLLIGAIALISISTVRADDLAEGEKLYARHCASCHGDKGEGSKRYEHSLIGDRSIDQLADVITKTMPESNPDRIVGNDAKLVAAYVHNKFYSKAARDGFAPPRVELARLTVPQYRNAIADIVALYRGQAWLENKVGLRAEYYKSQRTSRDNRVLERIDPNVDFDFGDKEPVPGIDPKLYTIHWFGSVIPPETGDYEIIVKSSDSIQLFLNDPGDLFIDGKVRSGDDDTFTAPIYMLAGRPMAIRLHFQKGKQGVKELGKNQLSTSYISLQWKRPDGTTEPIPSNAFSLGNAPKMFAVSASFPPDDRSMGWIRGTTISKQWDEATTDGAIETANYFLANIDELSKTKVGDGDREKKLKEFAQRFVEQAFRSKLTDFERTLYVDQQFAHSKNLEDAIKRVIILTLKSPRFLYREVNGATPNQTKANRLAFALWDSLPDQQMLGNVKQDWFGNEQAIRDQAKRMLEDSRAKAQAPRLPPYLVEDRPAP